MHMLIFIIFGSDCVLFKGALSLWVSLRQMEWWVKNGPITNRGVLPVTTLFFLKTLFQFKNLLNKDLI